jgi:hydroxyacylglutathione hydrolase
MTLILPFPSGPLATNAYLVLSAGKAAIIDPAPGCTKKVIKTIEERKLTPDCIICTHSHWDHIAEVASLAFHYSIPVMIHAKDAYNLMEPGSDKMPGWVQVAAHVPDRLLHEGDKITIGESSWQVIHTPGHTPGGICLYCEQEKVLLSGDTLFKRSIGNISFPTSNAEDMWQSLKKLALLPKETKVFPGHGEPTTIGAESWLDHAEQVFG